MIEPLATATGHYLTWGVISISVANALVIATMVILFALALLVPFGRRS
jgi:high-affinity Fe2+/Pb2+ permease